MDRDVEDRDHSPKNRVKTGLLSIEMELVWEGGKIVLTPSGSDKMAAAAKWPMGSPVSGLKSMVSGKPAYLVRFVDLEIALSFEELDRFLRYDLFCHEYLKIRSAFGMFHEIRDLFYDRADGLACQPVRPSIGLDEATDFFVSLAEASEMEGAVKRSMARVRPFVSA